MIQTLTSDGTNSSQNERIEGGSPLVSILINNFNYGRFVAQSIESALAQDYPRIEVVVVDDASTDDSQSVIRQYADRVRTVLLERNGGQAAAFNAASRRATGRS